MVIVSYFFSEISFSTFGMLYEQKGNGFSCLVVKVIQFF